jgi:hypothetical protein
MENEMIERVARALSDQLGNKPWADVRTADKEAFCESARAAIEAMRPELEAVASDRWTGPREAALEVGEGYVRGFDAACAAHRQMLAPALQKADA